MSFYRFSQALATLFFLFSVYYLAFFAWIYKEYQSYDQQALLPVHSVELIKNHRYHYQLKVAYTYSFQGKSYFQEQVKEMAFINPWSAELEKKQLLKSGVRIFFSSKAPEKGNLNARIPVKEGIYSSLLFSVAIYLLFLARYSRQST